jgi:imidazolonepropionase
MAALGEQCDYVDMFVEEGYFSHDACRRYCAAARSIGRPIRLHVDQLRNSGGAMLAAEVGALTADHLEHTDAKGIRALAEAGVMAGLLPGSVFGLRKSRYADGRAMIDAGVGVYLATDFNPGSSPVASMPFCMRLAVDHMGISIEEALVASTYNAACSLGLEHETGSIEVGKRADLCVFPLNSYQEIAYYVGIRPTAVILGGKLSP